MKFKIEMSDNDTPNLMRLNGVNVSFDGWKWSNSQEVYFLYLRGECIAYVSKKLTDWFASYVECE